MARLDRYGSPVAVGDIFTVFSFYIAEQFEVEMFDVLITDSWAFTSLNRIPNTNTILSVVRCDD